MIIFLVNTSSPKAFARGEQVFEALEGEAGVNFFQFVWASCETFGDQFDVGKHCPVILFVNSNDMTWKTMKLRSLLSPSKPDTPAKAWTLDVFLDRCHVNLRLET